MPMPREHRLRLHGAPATQSFIFGWQLALENCHRAALPPDWPNLPFGFEGARQSALAST